MVWQIQKKAADEDFPVVYKLFITLCKVFPPSPTTFQNALPQYAEYGKCTHKPFLKSRQSVTACGLLYSFT